MSITVWRRHSEDGEWVVEDIVGNIEHAMAIATEAADLGQEVRISDGIEGYDALA